MAEDYFQHQMGTPAWLTVHYWVDGSKSPRIHHVLMVGSCINPGQLSNDIPEALVLSETGKMYPITAYMKNMDAMIFKVVEAAQPKERPYR